MRLWLLSFFFFVVSYGTSYAHENKGVFVGQNGDETTFILEVIRDVPNDHILISEEGEVYIKVDKVIPIQADNLLFMHNLFFGLRSHGFEEEDVENCGSRIPPKKWQCPYCYLWWEMGERCQNPLCPTNQWKNK